MRKRAADYSGYLLTISGRRLSSDWMRSAIARASSWRAVRAELQAEERAAGNHVDGFRQPGEFPVARARGNSPPIRARRTRPAEGRCPCRSGAALAGTGVRPAAAPDRFHFDPRAAGVRVAELPGRGVRKIDDAVGVERAAVVDPHHHAAAVGQVGDARIAGNRQRGMRRGHRVHVVGLAARGGRAMEAAPIPAADAGLPEWRSVRRGIASGT